MDGKPLRRKMVPAVLASVSTAILIYILHYINFDILYGQGASAVIFAAFGASAFILFMMPREKSARMGAFIKSYIMGALVGAAGFWSLTYLPLSIVTGAIVFVLSMLMYATDSRHPPAIGIAVAFVLYRISSADGIIIVTLGIAILVFLKLALGQLVLAVEGRPLGNGRRAV